MTDPRRDLSGAAGDPDAKPDVAAGLIAALETEAALVDAGRFTLDVAAARKKMRRFARADPRAYLLLLVEAAHTLVGCHSLSLELGDHGLRARFEGASLSEDELRNVFDAAFVGTRGLSPTQARRRLGLRHLALALDAALGRPNEGVELRSVSARRMPLALRFTANGRHDFGVSESWGPGPAVELELRAPRFRGRLGRRRARARDRALLRERARHATVTLSLDGARIDVGMRLPELEGAVKIRDAEGQSRGLAGWSLARRTAMLIFVRHGVVIEEREVPRWTPGFLALVDASDLGQDLGGDKLRRDEAYRTRLGQIRRTHDTLPANLAPDAIVPPFTPDSQGQPLVAVGGSAALLGVAAMTSMLAMAGFGSGAWVTAGLFGFGAVGSALQARKTARAQRVQRQGIPGTAVLERMQLVEVPETKRSMLELELRVYRPDQVPYRAQTTVEAAMRDLAAYRAGARFLVRIDPLDPLNVVLDPKDS